VKTLFFLQFHFLLWLGISFSKASKSISFFHVHLCNLIGQFPTYFPFTSFKAEVRSIALAKLKKKYHSVLPVHLSLDILKDEYFENAFARTPSFTSIPRSPQNKRNSSFCRHQRGWIDTIASTRGSEIWWSKTKRIRS